MSRNKPIIRNVLADRYASAAMKSIWSGEGRVIIERDYWIAVMKAQRELGLKIPVKAIKAYESVKDSVSLASIDRRERKLLHEICVIHADPSSKIWTKSIANHRPDAQLPLKVVI